MRGSIFGLDFVSANIDDILASIKFIFENYLEHMEEIFTKYTGTGHKVYGTKSHFCRYDKEYLGYYFSRKR
jgi:ribonuclease HII